VSDHLAYQIDGQAFDPDTVYEPTQDFLLAKMRIPEITTAGGVVIPSNSQKPVAQAEVIAVGPGRMGPTGEIVVPDFHPGDVILFRLGGTQVELTTAGSHYVLIRAMEVVAKVHTGPEHVPPPESIIIQPGE
jgi:chaperonin GroES